MIYFLLSDIMYINDDMQLRYLRHHRDNHRHHREILHILKFKTSCSNFQALQNVLYTYICMCVNNILRKICFIQTVVFSKSYFDAKSYIIQRMSNENIYRILLISRLVLSLKIRNANTTKNSA